MIRQANVRKTGDISQLIVEMHTLRNIFMQILQKIFENRYKFVRML